MSEKPAAIGIGKNQGERSKLCLRSLAKQVSRLVYVDWGSSDGTVEFASSIGVKVVELDRSAPFTAARARNAGVEHLSRFSQWWKRAMRAGHAYAEGSHLHGAPPERMSVREPRRIVACQVKANRNPG